MTWQFDDFTVKTIYNNTIWLTKNCIQPLADYNNFTHILFSRLQLYSLVTKVSNITIIPTEVLKHKHFLGKQHQQLELNKVVRKENIIIIKKVQGKPCRNATSFTFLYALLMNPLHKINVPKTKVLLLYFRLSLR